MLLTCSNVLLASIFTSLCASVTPSTHTKQHGKDACHVYVVDIAKAKHAFDTAPQTNNEADVEKTLSVGQTIFPEFYPTIGEEELTTKHYRFPGSNLMITASVFYTDESMASHGHGESVSQRGSMLIGASLSRRKEQNAFDASAGSNASAEVTYDQYTNKVRAKTSVTVRGRMYLVGIECDCMANRRPK